MVVITAPIGVYGSTVSVELLHVNEEIRADSFRPHGLGLGIGPYRNRRILAHSSPPFRMESKHERSVFTVVAGLSG